MRGQDVESYYIVGTWKHTINRPVEIAMGTASFSVGRIVKEHRDARQRGPLLLDNPKKTDKIRNFTPTLFSINGEGRWGTKHCYESGRRIY
jgi:hypothetical protein